MEKYIGGRDRQLKYFVLEGTFVKELPKQSELQKAIDAHLAYLKIGFHDGSVLVSGPKAGTGGGIPFQKRSSLFSGSRLHNPYTGMTQSHHRRH